MSEEVEVKEETAEETKAESGESPSETATAGKKKKKINKLSPEEIKERIDELEKKNLTQSKYYKHLLQRRNELTK